MNLIPKRLLSALAAAATVLAPVCASLHAATITPVASGLTAPTKTTLTSARNLLVSEAGSTSNTGRVSLVDPATGSRRTLVEGLPSGVFSGEPSGPGGLLLRGRTLYLTIGVGDAVMSGPVAGTTVVNPRAGSPLFACILAFQFSADIERTTTALTLSSADHAALKAGTRITRDNGAGDNVTIELFADFPDYVAEPRPTLAENVRGANPFDLVVLGERLFVADASLNSIRTVDLATRAIGTLTAFAPLPNTRGMGPPVSEAVPDSIRVYGSQLLVTLLSGFPFPSGASHVRLVDPNTGASSPFISGLTTAIDVLPLKDGGFLTLEFAADLLAGPTAPPSGRLQWFAAPNAAPVIVADTLRNPTRLELDERTGSVFITEIFAGRVVKISPWSLGAVAPSPLRQFSSVSVRGNAGLGNETLIAGFTVEGTPKQVLIRGIGPRLSTFGVTGMLSDPKIVVYDSAGRAVAESDNWSATGDPDAALLIDAATKVGAFPLVAGSKDAALLRTLPPGAYTVHVTASTSSGQAGAGGASGVSLVEVFHVP